MKLLVGFVSRQRWQRGCRQLVRNDPLSAKSPNPISLLSVFPEPSSFSSLLQYEKPDVFPAAQTPAGSASRAFPCAVEHLGGLFPWMPTWCFLSLFKMSSGIKALRCHYECARVPLAPGFLPLLLSTQIHFGSVQPCACRKSPGPLPTSSRCYGSAMDLLRGQWRSWLVELRRSFVACRAKRWRVLILSRRSF